MDLSQSPRTSSSHGDSPQTALSAKALTRSFGRVKALSDVSLEVQRGEIHAVVGGNGAGKSTLMSVLSGSLKPNSGSVDLFGQPLPFGQPRKVREKGLAMVHQHFMLAGQMTLLENLMLDQLGTLGGLLSPEETRKRASTIADSIGWQIPLDAKCRELPVGIQQRAEIIKVLCFDPDVIILDEPTAVLSPDEAGELIQVLKRLKAQGKTIILIAHKLSEVFAAADRVTVLRQGRNAGQGRLCDIQPSDLAAMMLGEAPLPLTSASLNPGSALLRAQGLRVKGDRGEAAVKNATFEVRQGEILGIGGVDGNGQTELAEAIAGVRSIASGSLEAEETPGFIPPDRQADGLALRLSILENMAISGVNSPDLQDRGWLKRGAMRSWGQRLIREYQIKADSLDDPVSGLSGGNQQKVIVSRVLDGEPKVVVAVNPTRGLDMGAARFVRSELIKAAERGAAVVLFSTDREELAALAHRTLTMSGGQLFEAADLSQEGLLAGVVT